MYNCANCSQTWIDELPQCPHCGSPQIGPATEAGRPTLAQQIRERLSPRKRKPKNA